MTEPPKRPAMIKVPQFDFEFVQSIQGSLRCFLPCPVPTPPYTALATSQQRVDLSVRSHADGVESNSRGLRAAEDRRGALVACERARRACESGTGRATPAPPRLAASQKGGAPPPAPPSDRRARAPRRAVRRGAGPASPRLSSHPVAHRPASPTLPVTSGAAALPSQRIPTKTAGMQTGQGVARRSPGPESGAAGLGVGPRSSQLHHAREDGRGRDDPE